VQLAQHNKIAEYREVLKDNIFTCMEMSHQSYPDVMSMPIKALTDYLKWKTSLEEEKNKALAGTIEGK